MSETQLLQVDEFVCRYRPSKNMRTGEISELILLLHGWTGDENSMWVFASKIPNSYPLIALRGFYSVPWGGYSWVNSMGREKFPDVADFMPAVKELNLFLEKVRGYFPVDTEKIRIMGFSQGAAMAYVYALMNPQRVVSLAGLSGFMPDGVKTLLGGLPLAGKKVFISHGANDELVPVSRARQAVLFLRDAGADVTYCEAEVGHKLSADCFRGLEVFFG